MERLDKLGLTRRDMLRLSAGGAGALMLGAGGLAVQRGFSAGGGIYTEAFPTSPLILSPFNDALPVPTAAPRADTSSWAVKPGKSQSDSMAIPASDYSGAGRFTDRYGWTPGTHQLFPGDAGTPVANYPDPIVYQIKLQVNGHQWTSSNVQPINSLGQNVTPPGSSNANPRKLPLSTIYGFNGTFPGPRINAEYGKPVLVRFENELDKDNGFPRLDFGAPNHAFLTHLHNGHTAPESDGQPHFTHWRFKPAGREDHEAAYEPGEWLDNLYLGYPAGNDFREMQSFLWFHDHTHGHTGANVYKGMVGLMPIYDSVDANIPGSGLDPGDETKGLRLPGVRRNHADGTFDVDFDIPMALYDVRIEDGVTPHKDFHTGTGETHPEWWGRHYFRHLPNHGFVGDVFTVNCTAYPTLTVKRRKYRLRFLGASISRIYNLQLMSSTRGWRFAKDLGYTGQELQGQYRLPDGTQCMRMVQIASEGGLLPKPIVRDSVEIWPAKRREFIVDFTRYMDGTPTRKNDEIYLVNTMKMLDGRLWNSADPNYKVPIMKIVIESNALEPDNSRIPAALRPQQDLVPNAQRDALDPQRFGAPTFTLQRGSAAGQPETEWLINGTPFVPEERGDGLPGCVTPGTTVKRGDEKVWIIKNGGGGWVHPMHLHQEEHRVVARNRRLVDARHPDDTGKEDVVALDPSEEVAVSRRFRTFTGPYVAHCHNLAHEDHNMMFGWEIVP